jgi:ankyrin repeat protein
MKSEDHAIHDSFFQTRMKSDDHDGITIEIDDEVWDAVEAIVALICEVNGESYFELHESNHQPSFSGSFQSLEHLENSHAHSSSMDSGRSSLLATTNSIVSRIVEAVSEKIYRASNLSLHDTPELIIAITMPPHDVDRAVVPNEQLLESAATLESGQLALQSTPEHDDCAVNTSEVNLSQSEEFQQVLNTIKEPNGSSGSESKCCAQDIEFVCESSSKETHNSSHDELPPTLSAKNTNNLKGSILSQSRPGDAGTVLSISRIDSLKSMALNKGKTAVQRFHFVCDNNLAIEANNASMLLHVAIGTNQQNSSFSHHAELHKGAAITRFSCFKDEKSSTPLFTGLSLLHISCLCKDGFDKSIYDDLIEMGCKPEEESSNGCNVYAFAACQGNFEAMRHISLRHSSSLKSNLCRCRNAGRNILHCIAEFAMPSDYDSLFELFGPSLCTHLCEEAKGASDSPVFSALKLGNYNFLQSISKQVYIWNLTTTHLGNEQTFLHSMMASPTAHRCLLQMLANITSLESFVIQSTASAEDSSMIFKICQMGHINISSHVLKQQHSLYFLELDKVASFAPKIDSIMTRTGLITWLSKLLETHRANTVVLWHCIHLTISLSHDEEMALDLLSTANLDNVKNHRNWRSFDQFTGESALHIAAQKNWTEILTCLCDLGHDANPFCLMMRTPMHTAALQNCAKSIMLLNNLGADASIESGDGKTPIALSIETKNIECSMEILSNVGSRKSLFRTDAKGLSPLMRALESKQLQVAHKILKQYPEQANFVSMNGTNIFHAAAPHLASVQQLVSWSSQERKDIWAFLHQKNNDGETPKDIAAHCGYLDSLRFFLQIHQSKGFMNSLKSVQEMDVNYSESKDSFSQTDFSSVTSVQKFLSDHSEAINSYDFYHRTPFILAVQAKNLPGAQDLVDAGVDILRIDNLGNSAMHYMYLSKKEQTLWMWEEPTTSDTDPSDLIQCIIQRNSEDIVARCLTLRNKDGITPFCLAVMNEFYVDVALLCGEVKFPKSLLNVQLPNGTYCLHIACSKNLINLALLFLNLGSDPSVFDSNGMSPEYIARSNGHNSITLILMQFSNALKIQCAIRSYLSRVHALSHRADCIAVQTVLFKLIENPSTPMHQYTDLRSNFPRANWNAIVHPKHSDMVPMAYAAM